MHTQSKVYGKMLCGPEIGIGGPHMWNQDPRKHLRWRGRGHASRPDKIPRSAAPQKTNTCSNLTIKTPKERIKFA